MDLRQGMKRSCWLPPKRDETTGLLELKEVSRQDWEWLVKERKMFAQDHWGWVGVHRQILCRKREPTELMWLRRVRTGTWPS